ncbi:MAG: hypothetical protein A2V98_04025 [Planctomycetes bacterium RBG_16_64_12]|nr:MAG: hypothetical protein A2V98_04025 [Planctomycetes bacterium RBG_16_64_12]
MKALSLAVALTFALLAGSTASAAVVVGVGPVHVAVGRPAARPVVVAPRPISRPVPRAITYARIHNHRQAVAGAVEDRQEAFVDAVEQHRQAVAETIHERREAFWGAVENALNP